MRMNETEKELVAMVLAGRTEAFEPLVTPYRRPLLALAYRGPAAAVSRLLSLSPTFR